MSTYYQIELTIDRQEDGLWRIEAPSLNGCWVDCKTIEEGISDIQEVIAMTLELYKREGWQIPKGMSAKSGPPLSASIPLALEEFTHLKKVPSPSGRTKLND